jgi:hypothetical protein
MMLFAFAYLVLCFFVAILGSGRPLRFWGYFLSSLLLTPFVGLLLVYAAGDNRATPSRHEHHDG